MYAGLAGGAESIIVPEMKFELDDICKVLIERRNKGKLHSIIILAEGVGDAKQLEQQIMEKVDIEVRSTILGYIQRGGNTTAFDRILAGRLGARAVELLAGGKSARAVGIRDNKLIDMEIGEALSMKKKFPTELYELAVKLQ